MLKIYVTAILLLNCYCNVRSTPVCHEILRKKGYIGVIETAKREFNTTNMNMPTPNSVCQVGRKFSEELFTDPEAWLCLESIVQIVDHNMALYTASVDRCNVTNRINDIACGDFTFFQLCIIDTVNVTLHGLASGEGWDKNRCIKCREYSNFKHCVKKWKLDTQCPNLTRNVLNMNFARQSCMACTEQVDVKVGATSGPKMPIVAAAVGSAVAVLIILAAIDYYIFTRYEEKKELVQQKDNQSRSRSSLRSNTSFSNREQGPSDEQSSTVMSECTSKLTEENSKKINQKKNARKKARK